MGTDDSGERGFYGRLIYQWQIEVAESDIEAIGGRLRFHGG